ncbi:hypothetical protein BG418_01475 [Streptomyces sp. CBMA152]|nr:hypothetical protein [Streptomyces sp. CBMA152]
MVVPRPCHEQVRVASEFGLLFLGVSAADQAKPQQEDPYVGLAGAEGVGAGEGGRGGGQRQQGTGVRPDRGSGVSDLGEREAADGGGEARGCWGSFGGMVCGVIGFLRRSGRRGERGRSGRGRRIDRYVRLVGAEVRWGGMGATVR